MSSFSVGGKTYELLSLGDVANMELGDVEILERLGGLDLSTLPNPPVTIQLAVCLVYMSIRKSEPEDEWRYGDAVFSDPLLLLARKVKITVLKELTAEVEAENKATETGDAVPPTEEPSEPETSGPPDSASGLAA